MRNIVNLNISNNNVSDISAVRNMKKMTKFIADSNRITDISPLFSVSEISYVSLKNNSVSAEECSRLKTEKNCTVVID